MKGSLFTPPQPVPNEEAQKVDTGEIAVAPKKVAPEDADKILVDHALKVMQSISRTFQGISDTSVSQEKTKLLWEGDQLQDRVAKNFSETLSYLLTECRDLRFENISDVESFLLLVAEKLNNGLQSESQGIWRVWPSQEHHPRPEDIQRALKEDFYPEFMERFNTRDGDPVEFAAWIERRFNAEIHPLSDGCGRWSKTVAAFVLARAAIVYPQHPSRAVYFRHLLGPIEGWNAYYRGCIPPR